jgi:hypothetical protein
MYRTAPPRSRKAPRRRGPRDPPRKGDGLCPPAGASSSSPTRPGPPAVAPCSRPWSA